MKKLVLERADQSKKSSHALAAANIRRELKAKFPTTKFSVKSGSYSGGCSVRVDWMDGAKSNEVSEIVDRYQYGRFDGMEDIYNYSKDFNSDYGEAKYTFTQRSYSPEAYQKGVNYFGWDHIEVKVSEYSGSGYLEGSKHDEDMHIYSWLQEQDLSLVAKKEVHAPVNHENFEKLLEDGAVKDFEHTQSGEMLKVVRLTDTLKKEEFKAFNTWMKASKRGYYSRFAKGFVLTA